MNRRGRGGGGLPRPGRGGGSKVRAAAPEPIFSISGKSFGTTSSAAVAAAPVPRQRPQTTSSSKPSRAVTSTPKKKKKKKQQQPSVGGQLPVIISSLESKPAEQPAAKPAEVHPPFTGKVKIGYNHYRESFSCSEGRVDWAEVDDQFAISFVFHGEFKFYLTVVGEDIYSENHTQIHPTKTAAAAAADTTDKQKTKGAKGGKEDDKAAGSYFEGLSDRCEYMLQVEEDAVAGVGLKGITRSGPFKAGSREGEEVRSTNRAFDDLTSQLKGLSSDDLVAQTAEYQHLREARDLEDILFSG
jgi:hypothetical protein